MTSFFGQGDSLGLLIQSSEHQRIGRNDEVFLVLASNIL